MDADTARSLVPMLEWGEAFVAYPKSKRCLCLPFDDELNKWWSDSPSFRQRLTGNRG